MPQTGQSGFPFRGAKIDRIFVGPSFLVTTRIEATRDAGPGGPRKPTQVLLGEFENKIWNWKKHLKITTFLEDFNISMKIQRDSVTARAAGNEKIQIVTRRGSWSMANLTLYISAFLLFLFDCFWLLFQDPANHMALSATARYSVVATSITQLQAEGSPLCVPGEKTSTITCPTCPACRLPTWSNM